MYIKISVNNKIATVQDNVLIVNGNSDYVIKFDFDSEWDAYETKTARFVTARGYTDVVFSGDEVALPVIQNGRYIRIGVYAGDLRTTTPAVIFCRRCITDGSGSPVEPTPDVYAQIMERLNNLDGIAPATSDKLGTVKIGDNLKITEDGVLSVDTAEAVEQDNTKPVTSTAVYTAKSNIEALLGNLSELETEEKDNLVVAVNEVKRNGGGSSIALDTTLTQSGKAADAKAVGDALAEKQDSGNYVKSVNGTAPDASGNVTVEAGGGGSGGDAVVTAEKAFAASVLELNHVTDNQYAAQHDSVLFEATEDTTLSVGSDNIISSTPVSTSANSALAPTIVVTEVKDGYKYELNPDYTGHAHFTNYRVYFPVNIQNGKTYTLAFKSDGDCYLYLSADTASAGTLIGGKLIPTVDGKKVLTFTASADYGYVRITPNTLPRTLTEITLCEGDVALEYGGGAKTYSLSSGEKVWLSGVKGLNCVGVGKFYESPLAVTSFNGVAPSTGAVKSCATKKTWVNMGDSLWTFGASVGGIGTITDYMVALCGGTWHNIATGGTTMASRPGSYAGTYDALDFWKIADAIVAGNYTDAKAAAAELTSNFANIDNVNWSAVDYVTVAYGTNDLAFGAAIDNESNPLDTATICGALRYGIKAINGKYPNIRFKVLGVVYRSADAVTPAKIVECNEALRAAAAYVGAEFVDGYGINAGNSGTFLYDGTHPNANGKARIAETLARNIHEVWYE